MIDLPGNDTVVIAQIRGPLNELIHQLLPLPSDTILDTSQNAGDSVGRVIGVDKRIRDYFMRCIHDNARVLLLAGREDLGQPLEKALFFPRNDQRVLLDFHVLLYYLYLLHYGIAYGDHSLDALRVQALGTHFLPRLMQTMGIPTLTLQQHINRIDLQKLQGIGH